MADITMCFGQGCKKKEQCYRFKATPDERRQSYFVGKPDMKENCSYFWPLDADDLAPKVD